MCGHASCAVYSAPTADSMFTTASPAVISAEDGRRGCHQRLAVAALAELLRAGSVAVWGHGLTVRHGNRGWPLAFAASSLEAILQRLLPYPERQEADASIALESTKLLIRTQYCAAHVWPSGRDAARQLGCLLITQ